ncbi:hotdog fold thioesterase [Rhodobacterales bacterium HKCCE3408]|nr:hotdog fold thioesterase [Rhodobacterales bacterium HKCCE3408]
MTPDDLQAALAEYFAPWIHDLGMTVTEVGPDGAVTTMEVTPALSRVGGIVCGQALAAMADTSMVLALAAHRGEFVAAATTNLDTQFLRPGTGLIACRATIVRAGRSVAFARAEMSGADGRPVAQATATMLLPG